MGRFDVLSADERRLLTRLSIFRSGCTLEAAEDICDASAPVLFSLVDKSLVRHAEGRFWLSENVLRHASDQLGTSSEAHAVHSRHAEYFVALAELALRRGIWRAEELLERLTAEYANLHAALDWLQASGDTQNALLTAAVVSRLASRAGQHAVARRCLDSTLAADTEPTEPRAFALDAAAELAVATDDPARARAHAEEALAIRRELGDLRGVAHSTFILGHVGVQAGDLEAAHRLFAESLEILHAHTLDRLGHLAFFHAQRGRAELATMLLSSSLALQKETDLGPPVEQLQLNARTLERVRDELEDAVFADAWEKGTRLSLDEAISLALDETSS